MQRKPFDPSLINVPQSERIAGPSGPISVAQLTAMIKQAIESALPATVHVVGEISNFKRHSSGHLYFTLKDRSSELSCVMWRSAAAKLKFAPADGLEVIATGAVEMFERAGRYQLYVRRLEPRGVGALELAFRQLCEKLEREGLFDDRHKRPLPPYPSRIVLVTSPTGAAVVDMIRTIERRHPGVQLLVYPVRVQGEGAAGEIANAIRKVNAQAGDLGGVEVMIVGRGGGSLEDLWPFNEEVVARAIFASRIPIVSAVGHEVDVSVADLVADVRAATPSAAAEITVPVLAEVLESIRIDETRLTRAMTTKAQLGSTRLAGLLQRSALREPLLAVHRREQAVDELSNRVQRSVAERMNLGRQGVDALEPIIQRIAPHVYLLRTADRLREARHRLRWAVTGRLAGTRQHLVGQAHRLQRNGPANIIPRLFAKLDSLAEAVPIATRHRVSLLGERVRRRENVLAALSYKSVLGRGFSITRLKKGRRVVRSLQQLTDRDRITTELADGEFDADVVNLKQLELFD